MLLPSRRRQCLPTLLNRNSASTRCIVGDKPSGLFAAAAMRPHIDSTWSTCLLVAANRECPAGRAKCPNSHRCISVNYFCDNDNDCGDNSDENTELCGKRLLDKCGLLLQM